MQELDVLENPVAYANLLQRRIAVNKNGVSKLTQLQQIRAQVLQFPHCVQFSKPFLEATALEIFNRV